MQILVITGISLCNNYMWIMCFLFWKLISYDFNEHLRFLYTFDLKLYKTISIDACKIVRTINYEKNSSKNTQLKLTWWNYIENNRLVPWMEMFIWQGWEITGKHDNILSRARYTFSIQRYQSYYFINLIRNFFHWFSVDTFKFYIYSCLFIKKKSNLSKRCS